MRGRQVTDDFKFRDYIPPELVSELEYIEAKAGLQELTELLEGGMDD